MLVLTRKLDEQILIGEDIKVTLLRVRGNTVRIGIEAPRDVRIIRGELEPRDESSNETLLDSGQPSAREQAFAHPPTDRMDATSKRHVDRVAGPQLFVGSVNKGGAEARLRRAPLAQFVASAS
jgi:carbon storage regulator CsrA